MDGLPFVTGAICHQRRGVRVQVRVREPRKSRPPPGSGGGKSSNAAARKLTVSRGIALPSGWSGGWPNFQ